MAEKKAEEATEEKAQETPKEPKEEVKAKPAKKVEKGAENLVFVGKKSTSAYVLAVMTQFSKGAPDVIIKARGRAISRAVDVAEIVRNKPEIAARIDAINLSTEEVQTQDGKPLKVSAIEIVLKK